MSCSTARGLVTLSRFKPRINDIGAGRGCVKPDLKAGFTVKQNPRIHGSLCQDRAFTLPVLRRITSTGRYPFGGL